MRKQPRTNRLRQLVEQKQREDARFLPRQRALEGLPRKALRVIADVQDAAERDRLLREALTPRPKAEPPSLTSPGEVSAATAKSNAPETWLVQVYDWLARIRAVVHTTIARGSKALGSGIWTRFLRPSS